MTTDSFIWNDDYSVGNPVLDAQHKKILEMCARVDRLPPADDPGYQEKVGNIILFLNEYGRVHFETEEKVLLAIGYPEFASHEKQHQEYSNKFQMILGSLETADIDMLELRQFLHQWWIGHILNSDMKYKPHFDRAGSS